jgi:hypothetical protein
MAQGKVEVVITADTTGFVRACEEAELAFRRFGRAMGYRGDPMSRWAWFVAWLRWRQERPVFEAGERWERRYNLWLARRPLRDGRRLDALERCLVGLFSFTLLYLSAHVIAWL